MHGLGLPGSSPFSNHFLPKKVSFPGPAPSLLAGSFLLTLMDTPRQRTLPLQEKGGWGVVPGSPQASVLG